MQKYSLHVRHVYFFCFKTRWAHAFLPSRHIVRMLLRMACIGSVLNCGSNIIYLIYIYNVCIRFSTSKVRRMKRCRSFIVLFDKPSRIEWYCRPEYKSADPNWFVRRTFHVLNSNFRFGTWKVRRLNRALAKLASYVFLFFNFFFCVNFHENTT